MKGTATLEIYTQTKAKMEKLDSLHVFGLTKSSCSDIDLFCKAPHRQKAKVVGVARYPDLKGQPNEIFDFQFFSTFKPAWAIDQGVKIFSNLIKLY